METDEMIIRGIKLKQNSAWEQFLEKYGRLIKSIVSYHLKYFPDYCDDCIQDILISIWENIDRYDSSKNSFKNWIGAISKYKSIDMKRKHFPELLNSPADENLPAPPKEIISETEDEIKSILSCLSPDDRELFYRHYILGESVTYISKTGSKTSAFLYNRLSRGRSKLRKNLQGGIYHEK